MKFVVDENLSPTIAQRLNERGHPAQHVSHVGKAGISDAQLWTYAFAQDAIVVTTNYGDFLQLASTVEVHPGLIVYRRGGLTRDEQWACLVPVLEWLEGPNAPDLTNQVVEVTSEGKFVVRDIP